MRLRKRRFDERSTAERGNSLLKECYGGRTVRVRGFAKVVRVANTKAQGKTPVVTLAVPKGLEREIRFFRRMQEK